MQTTGASQERRCLTRLLCRSTAAQGQGYALGLLYLPAVRDDSRKHRDRRHRGCRGSSPKFSGTRDNLPRLVRRYWCCASAGLGQGPAAPVQTPLSQEACTRQFRRQSRRMPGSSKQLGSSGDQRYGCPASAHRRFCLFLPVSRPRRPVEPGVLCRVLLSGG